MSRTFRNVAMLPFVVINARRVRTRNGAVQELRAVDEMRAHGFDPRPRSARRIQPEVTGYSGRLKAGYVRPNAGYRETLRRNA